MRISINQVDLKLGKNNNKDKAGEGENFENLETRENLRFPAVVRGRRIRGGESNRLYHAFLRLFLPFSLSVSKFSFLSLFVLKARFSFHRYASKFWCIFQLIIRMETGLLKQPRNVNLFIMCERIWPAPCYPHIMHGDVWDA